MVDPQQDWIEKYRAALDRQPQRRAAPLTAAVNLVVKVFAFALGKTFGKPGAVIPNSAAVRRSPESAPQEHPRIDAPTNQASAREKSPRQEPRHDKKAS